MKRFIKSAIACVAAVAMAATVAPVTTYAAEKTTVVSTQKALDAAIKAGKKNITIKTTKAVKFTISKASSKADITINAKNATITNKSSVKSLTIKGAKAFTESGKFNEIKIATSQKMTLKVTKGSTGADITVAKANAKVTVKADGDVSAVNVEAKGVKVALSGKSDSQVAIIANKNADKAEIVSAIPADITVKAGADGAKVTAKADVKLSVAKNASLDKVSVAAAGAAVDLTAKGTVTEVKVAASAKGATLDINASGKVASVTVDAKADVAVKGSTTQTVKVTVNAADTTVKASTAVDTTLNASAKVDLAAGAEGSKVAQGSADVKVEVSNKTSEKVTITDSTGKESTVEAGKSENTAEPSKPAEDKPAAGGGASGSNSGSTTPTYKTYTYDPNCKLVVVTSNAIEAIYNTNKTAIEAYKVTVGSKSQTYSVSTLKTFIKEACTKVNEAAKNGKATATYTVSKNVVVTITNVTTGSTSPIQIKATYGNTEYKGTVTIQGSTVTVAQAN